MTDQISPTPLDSPEQRRRRSMLRKPVFTVAMAAPDVQRKFLSSQRFLFALQVFLGLAGMFAAALLLPRPGIDLLWPLAGATGFLLALSFVSRLRLRWLQPLAFSAGLIVAGLAVGWLLQPGPDLLNRLLNPTLAVGGLLLGLTVNSLLFRRERSGWAEYLLNGPWLVGVLAGMWFFPAGESLMAASGLAGVLLAYCALRAGPEALPVYQPNQTLAASADVIPLACIASFRWLWGRD